jgi:hypothetical protein
MRLDETIKLKQLHGEYSTVLAVRMPRGKDVVRLVTVLSVDDEACSVFFDVYNGVAKQRYGALAEAIRGFNDIIEPKQP